MDWNKKLTALTFLIVLSLCVTACSIQNTGFTGLYVDNNAEDLEENDKTNLKKNNALRVEYFDTLVYSKGQDDDVNITFDSVFSNKFKDENNSSLISNQFKKADTSEISKNTLHRNVFQSKTDDSLGEVSFEAQNKKFIELKEQIKEDKNSVYNTDSTFVLTEAQKINVISGSGDTQKDSITSAEINSEQDQTSKTDSIFVNKQTEKNLKENNANPKKEEILTAENDSLKKQIERLKSQQNTQREIQQNTQREIQQAYVEQKAPKQETEQTNDKKVETSRKEIVKYKTKEKRDRPQPIVVSIPQRQQNKSQTRDTISSESKTDSIMYDLLNSQKDTINQLKDKLSMIESYQQLSDTVYKINEITIYKSKQIDSVNITAFYDMGKTIPSNKVFDELKEIFQSQPIEKVMLSGYTDASGNQSINKALTYKRLEYIKEFVSKFVPINSIYVQNFGEMFASNEIISSERRVEIALYIKQKNEQIETEE